MDIEYFYKIQIYRYFMHQIWTNYSSDMYLECFVKILFIYLIVCLLIEQTFSHPNCHMTDFYIGIKKNVYTFFMHWFYVKWNILLQYTSKILLLSHRNFVSYTVLGRFLFGLQGTIFNNTCYYYSSFTCKFGSLLSYLILWC